MIRIEKQALAAGEGVVRRGGVGGNDDGKVDDGDGFIEAEEGKGGGGLLDGRTGYE